MAGNVTVSRSIRCHSIESMRKTVPLLGGSPELTEDEAGDRAEAVAGEFDRELVVEVVDREGAVDPDGVLIYVIQSVVERHLCDHFI